MSLGKTLNSNYAEESNRERMAMGLDLHMVGMSDVVNDHLGMKPNVFCGKYMSSMVQHHMIIIKARLKQNKQK